MNSLITLNSSGAMLRYGDLSVFIVIVTILVVLLLQIVDAIYVNGLPEKRLQYSAVVPLLGVYTFVMVGQLVLIAT